MMQNYTIYAYILYTLYIYCTADIIIFPLVPGGPLYNTSPPPNFVLLFYEMIFPLILVVVGSDRGGEGGWGMIYGAGELDILPACLPSNPWPMEGHFSQVWWAIGLH